MLHYT